MADKIAFSISDGSGNPLTTATPSFAIYKSKAGGALTPPAITHLGGGVYGFQPSDADMDAGAAFLITTGASPANVPGAAFLENSPFTVSFLIDSVGALWTGGPPTVPIYTDFAGAPRAAPVPLAIGGAYLYSIVPSLADIVVGSAYRIDAPALAQPRFQVGSFFPPGGSPPAPLSGLEAFEAAIQGIIALATGLPGSKVIWAHQTRERPARPFVELALLEDSVNEHSETGIRDNPAPIGGEEILLDVIDHRRITVQARVFSSAVVGSQRALNIGNQIRRYVHAESAQSALGDIAVVDRGVVRDASIVLETEHEGRAILDVVFRLGDLFTEATTYIQTATVETTVHQTAGPVVRTITITAP